MTRYVPSALKSVLLLLVFSLGCAGTPAAFATRYPDNIESDFSAVVSRAQAGAARATPPIAAGVTASGKLYGYDLAAKRVLWEAPAHPRFSPLLAGNAVVIQEGGRVVGLDVKTGSQRFQFDAGDMHLVGADGVDERVVIALTSGQGTFARSQVVLLDGVKRVWNHTLAHPVGVPALTGDVVLVPWSNQYLSGLDAASGEELSRLRVRDGVISHAFVNAGHVNVGSEHGIALLSHQLLAGDLSSGAHYIPPERELPGQPAFLYDAYDPKPLPPPESAHSRVQLTWESAASANGQGNTVSLTANNVYLIFYRFVLALDQRDYTLRWAHTHDVDVVGGRAQHDGIVIADSNGAVTYLGAESGSPLWKEQNAPASVDLEFPANQNAIGGMRKPAVAALNLREQLATAARDPDARLVPVRLLVVQLLAELPDAAATGDLVSLCEDDRTTLAVRKAACKLLTGRTVGGEHVLHALQRHASFLEATTAPPVGALAKAASAQKETRAAPLLISHLRDPNTPTENLPEMVQSLGELGDAEAVEPLRTFFRLYHADPIDEHVARAVSLVPAALLRLQGAEAKPLLTAVAEDGMSSGGATDAANKALATLSGAPADATTNAEAASAPASAEGTEQAAAKPEEQQAPPHITVDIIKQVLLPVHDPLQTCVRDSKPEAFQARVVLVVEDGQVLMVSVLPENLQTCIEPLVRSQQFPLTHLSQRDRVTYVIKRF